MWAWLSRESPCRFSNGGLLIITGALVTGLIDSASRLFG